MTSAAGLRLAVAGASGTLGRDVLAVLEERRFPVRELVPFATDRSTGQDVEFFDEVLPVESEAPPLRGFDLLILCAPPAASLALVRDALRAEVPCIDCSGALAGSPEVPLLVSDLCPPAAALAPVVATPAGPAHAWSLVLSAIERAAGLRRVTGTALRSASLGGRSGIESLSRETIALLCQQELPDPSVFPATVAFDCVPSIGERDFGPAAAADGATPSERELVRDLHRLLGRPVPILASLLQVPTFVGDGSSLAVETQRALSPEQLPRLLEKAPGLELWTDDAVGPTTRAAAGRDVALVGRPRPDPSLENGIVVWVVADAIRMAAANAVRLAEARLRLH